MNKVEHLVLVLICKADAEHKEIHASDWLKPLIAMLLLTLFFYVLHPRIGFVLEETYL